MPVMSTARWGYKSALGKSLTSAALAALLSVSGSVVAQAATKPDTTGRSIATEAASIRAAGAQLSVWVNGTKYVHPVKSAVPTGRIGAMAFTSQTWAACGYSSTESKLVRTFTAGQPPLIIKPAYLRCGTDSWGYRHINARHSRDWAAIGGIIGADWRSFADFAIATSLSNSYRVVSRFYNNTTMYKGVIQIKNSKGVVLATYYPEIVRANQDGKIITAYPSRTR